MINVTHQDKLRITLKKGTTLFSLSNCDNIKVFLTSSYVKFPLNYQAIDGMLYCDIPSTIPAKTYGIDISGEKDGLPFSTKYNNVINVTEEPVTGDTENTYTSHNLTLSIGIEEECNSERTQALLRRIDNLTSQLDELQDIQNTINTLKQQLAEAQNGLQQKDVDIIEISNKLEETQSLLVNTWQQLLQVLSQSDSSEWKQMYDDIIDQKNSELEVANERIDSLIQQILDLQEYAVLSVNDKTGVVTLNAEDVGALPDNTELFNGNYNSLSNKPDLSIYQQKEAGKGLSTNDYTDEDKYKLSQLEDNTSLINLINNKQDTINDLSNIRSGAALGATAIQQEQDPTVPSWAKQPNKPTYTAQEVGALSSDTQIPNVPSWALQQTKPTYTASEVGALPSTTTIPTLTSQLTNDSNFLTSHQDISGKEDKLSIITPTISNNTLTLTSNDLGKFIKLGTLTSATTIALPNMTNITHIIGCIFDVTIGTGGSLIINATQDIYESGLSDIEEGKRYEINAIYATEWRITVTELTLKS